MSLGTDFFGVKLKELERAYEILIKSKNAENGAEITESYNNIKALIANDEMALKRMAGKSKLPFLSELTRVQLDYYSTMADIFEKEIAVNVSYDTNENHNAEMSALFSEYMIDSAVYAARKALLSYLHTLLLAMEGGSE